MKQWLLNLWKAQDNASMVDWLREKEADLEVETDRLRREIRGSTYKRLGLTEQYEVMTAAKRQNLAESADKQFQRGMR